MQCKPLERIKMYAVFLGSLHLFSLPGILFLQIFSWSAHYSIQFSTQVFPPQRGYLRSSYSKTHHHILHPYSIFLCYRISVTFYLCDTSTILCLYVCIYSPPLLYKLCEDRDSWFCPWLYHLCLEQCLTHSGHSVTICELSESKVDSNCICDCTSEKVKMSSRPKKSKSLKSGAKKLHIN